MCNVVLTKLAEYSDLSLCNGNICSTVLVNMSSYYDYYNSETEPNYDSPQYEYNYDYPNPRDQERRPVKKSPSRKSDQVAAFSSGGGDCCPHVVDAGFYFAILAGIAVAVYLINEAITMNLRRRKRRKRNADQVDVDQISDLVYEGNDNF